MNLSSLFDLSGKTALVTGSSEGLGLAMARGLAAAGAAIVLNGRDEKKLAGAAKSIADDGHNVAARAFDVADEVAVISAFEQFDAAGVDIDILVNNAGIQLRKPMVDLKTDEWRRDQEQNLWESDYLAAADYARFLKTDYEQAKAVFIELGLARKDL